MGSDKATARGRRQAFIAALEKGLSVTGAAAAAGINRTLAYKWREALPDFAAAWEAAVQSAADLLEDEALRRAMEGVEKPVFYRGQQIGAVRTYNDRLLALLLQRRRPAPPAPRPPSKAELAAEERRRKDEAWRATVARMERSIEEDKARRRELAAARERSPAAAAPGRSGPNADSEAGSRESPGRRPRRRAPEPALAA